MAVKNIMKSGERRIHVSSRSGPHHSPADFHFANNQGTRNKTLVFVLIPAFEPPKKHKNDSFVLFQPLY